MNSSNTKKRSTYSILAETLIPFLVRECKELAVNGHPAGAEPILYLKFAEMQLLSVCKDAPNGIDLRSQVKSRRGCLYGKGRMRLQRKGVYHTAWYKEGIKWTAVPGIGIRWRASEVLERAKSVEGQLAEMCTTAGTQQPSRRNVFKQLRRSFRSRSNGAIRLLAESAELLNSGESNENNESTT